MKIPTGKRRVILDGEIDGSVIRGTLTAPSGVRREFHGWLELNTALEAMLDTGADYAPNKARPRAPRPQPTLARRAPRLPRNSINLSVGGPAPSSPLPAHKPLPAGRSEAGGRSDDHY